MDSTAPLGSTARTNQLLGGKFFDESTGAALKPFLPTSAGSITPVASPTLPQISPATPDLSGVNGRVNFYKTSADFYMKEAERLDAERAKQAETPVAQASDDWLQNLLKRTQDPATNPANIRREGEETTGINPKQYFAAQQASLAELETLNTEYNNTVAQRDQAIADRQARGGGLVSGTDQAVTKIERDFAIRLNQQAANIKSKAALMEAREGNFKEAQDFISGAVADATADTKYTLDLFNTFYTKNQDQIEKLDKKYSDALKNAMTSAEEAYTADYNEKLKIGELMIDSKYAGAGITLNDSLESAFGKISSGIASGAIGGSSGYEFSSTQKNSGAFNAGLTPTEFAKLPADVQNFYVNLSEPQKQEIAGLLTDIRNGDDDAEEAKADIDTKALTPAVKQHLKSQIDAAVPKKEDEGPGAWARFRTWAGF
jgi:hypothetical protein